MEYVQEAMIAVSILLSVLLVVALWSFFYRLFASLFSIGVKVSDTGQFHVVTYCSKTGINEIYKLSVPCAPHNRKAVVRAIVCWGVAKRKPVVEVSVNAVNGETIYRTY